MSLVNIIRSAFLPIIQLSERWAKSRRPKGVSIELNQRRIFIFPTAMGWGYLLLCLVLYLVAINYQNNLIHAFSFLLIALGVLTIHYTFLNLSGLCITGIRGGNGYAGEMIEFQLRVSAKNRRSYENVMLQWKDQEDSHHFYLDRGEDKLCSVYAKSEQRGLFRPEALLIATRYPFGLLRAWSWIELDISSVVYPKPLKGDFPEHSKGDSDGEHEHQNRGDDFAGLEQYQPGISTKHIAWKQFAQGRGLLVKNYLGQESKQVWLCWDQWPSLSVEKRLSVIAYWVKELEKKSIVYGVEMPNLIIHPDGGPEHSEKVLTALALFGLPDNHV